PRRGPPRQLPPGRRLRPRLHALAGFRRLPHPASHPRGLPARRLPPGDGAGPGRGGPDPPIHRRRDRREALRPPVPHGRGDVAEPPAPPARADRARRGMSYTNGAARNGSGAYGSLWAPGQRPDRLEHAPPFPTTVYATLPAPLRLAAGHFAAGAERDVFLTGALTVLSGMMPKVQAYNIDGAYAPHLLSIVVAPASAGKGALRYARGFGYSTQKFIEAEYERE